MRLSLSNDRAQKTLEEEGFEVEADREIVALIAYLQRLGVDIENGKTAKK